MNRTDIAKRLSEVDIAALLAQWTSRTITLDEVTSGKTKKKTARKRVRRIKRVMPKKKQASRILLDE